MHSVPGLIWLNFLCKKYPTVIFSKQVNFRKKIILFEDILCIKLNDNSSNKEEKMQTVHLILMTDPQKCYGRNNYDFILVSADSFSRCLQGLNFGNFRGFTKKMLCSRLAVVVLHAQTLPLLLPFIWVESLVSNFTSKASKLNFSPPAKLARKKLVRNFPC